MPSSNTNQKIPRSSSAAISWSYTRNLACQPTVRQGCRISAVKGQKCATVAQEKPDTGPGLSTLTNEVRSVAADGIHDGLCVLGECFGLRHRNLRLFHLKKTGFLPDFWPWVQHRYNILPFFRTELALVLYSFIWYQILFFILRINKFYVISTFFSSLEGFIIIQYTRKVNS